MDDEFWRFVEENAGVDPAKLRLKYHSAKGGIDYAFAITQIECRKRFAKKLRQTLASNPHFLFPSGLAGEQATSDLLAEFHATLIKDGECVADLTAGLGIDASHLAQRAKAVTAVEWDESRAECLEHNFGERMVVVNANCADFLSQCPDEAFDAAFIDPARRAGDGSRVFALADCEPNLIELLPLIRRKARLLIVKASPMLDITSMLRDLPGCRAMYAIGNHIECRELLAVVDLEGEPMQMDDVRIEAVTLAEGRPAESFAFTKKEESKAEAHYAVPKPGAYLLEPYPAVMKAAPYDLLSQRYGVGKMHPNTQLYVGESIPADFPGEAFKVEAVIPYESKYIKRLKSEYPRIQVTTRNFDVSADDLRKKLGVKDGGNKRLFAVTCLKSGMPQKLMIAAEAEISRR